LHTGGLQLRKTHAPLNFSSKMRMARETITKVNLPKREIAHNKK
jgi:hypothetical protein